MNGLAVVYCGALLFGALSLPAWLPGLRVWLGGQEKNQ